MPLDAPRHAADRSAACLRSLGGVGLLLLAGCNSAIGTEVTRAAAKNVVNAEVQSRFPGVPAEPVTDCVIDNATSDEIITVATASATGPTAQTSEIIGTVLRRPATIQCLGTQALPTVLTSL